jgi:hypothetical protein
MSSDNHLPVSLSQETWDHGLPFIDICDLDLTVEQLGQAIVTNNEAGLDAGREANSRLVTAGRLLREANSRVPNFEDFLRVHCNGLSRSWAYTLIKIANGKGDEVRADARARKLRHRQKQKANPAYVRSGTDTRQLSQDALLAQFKLDFEAWLSKLDDETFKRAIPYILGQINDRDPPLTNSGVQ